MGLKYRSYGLGRCAAVVLHGGPAAAGNIAPVARELAADWRVLEPWQRGAGDEPLTVSLHVEDLREFLAQRCPGEQPVLIGESWGAMLALTFAAAHPNAAAGLILISCGTFDPASRCLLHDTLKSRTTPQLQEELTRLTTSVPEPSERLPRIHALMSRIYEYDPQPASPDGEIPPFDRVAHEQTWQDMLGQQEAGRYPAQFACINCPVAMIHGDYDPHPGRMIRDSLQQRIPQLQYYELRECGHTPWQERRARSAFFSLLGRILHQMLSKTLPADCTAPQ